MRAVSPFVKNAFQPAFSRGAALPIPIPAPATRPPVGAADSLDVAERVEPLEHAPEDDVLAVEVRPARHKMRHARRASVMHSEGWAVLTCRFLDTFGPRVRMRSRGSESRGRARTAAQT